jgi:hypothetical protein
MVRARVALAIVGLALSACASGAARPPTPPEDIVSGLRAATATELASDAVAADALHAGELRTLLEDAGFESAVERSYSGPNGAVRRVDVRVVRFSSADGAERYLSWLQAHVEDVIGQADPAAALEIPPASVFLHLPGGCCPKDPSVALAAWRDGRDVLRVIVSGPGADGQTASTFIVRVERWWKGS